MAYGGGGRGGFNRGGGFNRSGGSGGGFRRSFGPREMHAIKCSECGKDAEVPFRPREGTPVYCRDCFMKKKGITPREQTDAPKKEEYEDKESFGEDSEEKTEEVSEEADDQDTDDNQEN